MSNPKQDEAGAGLEAGLVVDGRYKIIRPIGQGGNGMVHEVEHVRTGRKLALKSLLDEAGYGRLEQEARATSLITSGHATKITDMGTSKETGPYLVMELLEGQSLRALLDDAGQLPLELMVNIALQVCECLHEAHEQGIIHRDLKPENVFLSPSPWPGQHDVKVLDFGVVKISNDGPIPNASLTRTGSTVGTPYYMSLEQLRNSSAVDARADIYALGVVLYESLSGKKPFMAETIGDLVYALCSGPPTHLGRLRPDLPTEVTDMVMASLSADKDQRPKSMSDFGAALLPHGNSAFGLWVRVDGKQPALARQAGPASQSTAVLTPSAVNKPLVGAGGTAIVARPKDFVVPKPAAGAPAGGRWSAPAPDTVTAVEARKPESGRRDTPTEMYLKEAHEAVPESTSGDRDTPTRAIAAVNYEDSQRRRPPVTATLKAATFGDAHHAQDAVGRASAPDLGLMATMPASSLQGVGVPENAPLLGMKSTMPLQPMSMPMPLPQPSLVDVPFKPGWQLALDRTLVGIGRTIESWLAKYRSAPKNTQRLVLVCMASVLLFLVVLVLFLVIH